MALRAALQSLSFSQTGVRLIPTVSYNHATIATDYVPKRHHRWVKTDKGLSGAYPQTTMLPVTEKEELMEMSPSDPRRFNEIKALEQHDYFCCLQDPLVEKFIRKMINKKDMKRSINNYYRKVETREIMYNCLEFIKHSQLEKYYQAETQEEKDSIETNPYKVLYTALENARPLLTLTNIRKGAVIYRVPIPVSEDTQYNMALKWFVEAGRLNKVFEDAQTAQRMANEILAAFANTGKVIRQKQELHKEAEANKAYAHFRWGRK